MRVYIVLNYSPDVEQMERAGVVLHHSTEGQRVIVNLLVSDMLLSGRQTDRQCHLSLSC